MKTKLAVSLALGLAAAGHPGLARAADAKDRPPPTAADFARLEKEVADQRQLIIQMMQVEQERYDILLKFVQAQAATRGAAGPAVPPSAGAKASKGAETPAARAPEASGGAHESALASVTGRVQARSGTLKDTWVYVDLVRGSPAHGKTLEIKQKDKQFWPRAAVVLRGTNVVFPNLDPVYHNVFSTSDRNGFDLGAYRAGETPRSVVLSTPGVVDVYCNIHARMSASILVAPSPLYAKVNADGTFKIENVPTGVRKLVAWSPGSKPAQEKVEVGASGGQANFVLDEEGATTHLNKTGQPYGSYKD